MGIVLVVCVDEQEFEKLTIQMGIFTDYYCAAKGWKCLSNDQCQSTALYN